MELRKLDSPDPCHPMSAPSRQSLGDSLTSARSNIKDTVRVLQRRKVEAVIADELHHGMVDVEPLLFGLVGGHEVLVASIVRVVFTPWCRRVRGAGRARGFELPERMKANRLR